MSRDPSQRKTSPAWAIALVLAALGWASPGVAQIVGAGGLGGLPVGVGLGGELPAARLAPSASNLSGIASDVVAGNASLVSRPLNRVRALANRALLRNHPEAVEADERGQAVVRGEVLAISPGPEALARLRNAGFSVRSQGALEGLGLETALIGLPKRMSAIEALRRLRELDPEGIYDFNHLYQASGSANGPAAPGPARGGGGDGRGLSIGLVDGGVAENRPLLARAHIIQRGFAPGAPGPSAHGAAVASLIVGDGPGVRGSARGATLYVADVYGSTPAGGSAEAVARALAWLARSGVPVINISLVGPPNRLVEAAVRALVARGHLLVAAVGNDGPAAAPLYPAAYPGVVAVTAVDARRRPLPEAGRAGHVDFAAQGSDLKAAGLSGGPVNVRGTSFAAPMVAGALARRLPRPDRALADRAIEALGRAAVDLGSPGPDPVFGRGLVVLEENSQGGG